MDYIKESAGVENVDVLKSFKRIRDLEVAIYTCFYRIGLLLMDSAMLSGK